MPDITVDEVPQPTNVSVGFTDTDSEEADIERQLLEAESKGTSLGEIEDAKQKEKVEDKPADEQVADGKEGAKEPDNSETPAEKAGQARDEKGKFVKDESKFEKAKKDAERKDRSWKALEAEKEATRAKEAEIERQRSEIEQARERLQEQAKNRGDFSPQEYHKASQEFNRSAWKALSEGDNEKAKELFTNASYCQKAAQKTWELNLVQARDKDVADTCKKYPELNDLNSDAGKAMMQLLKENPYLAQLPNGFSKAAQFLVHQRDAARVSELEGQLQQAITERDKAREELKAATSLAGAGSQSPPASKDFDNMSDSEQEKEVGRMFNERGEFIHA